MLTVDTLGRRPLLLYGVTGMVISLVALSLASLQLSGTASAWTSVAALLVYVGTYQVRRSSESPANQVQGVEGSGAAACHANPGTPPAARQRADGDQHGCADRVPGRTFRRIPGLRWW